MSAVGLILAGGTGSRMGRPKQFIELLGKPALHHTLRAFQKTPGIVRIYTVGDHERIKELVSSSSIGKYAGCAAPGECRSLSTRNGLAMCRETLDTLVLVHDGSRCLVTPELIQRVIDAADETGADGVIPTLPVSDAIKVVEDNFVQETLDRSRLHATQTPQAFRLGVLRRAHDDVPDSVLRAAVDDASLVERRGGRVTLVAGEKTNIKLTSPEDLIFAEAIMSSRPAQRGSRSSGLQGVRS